jgi:hypothetical protein
LVVCIGNLITALLLLHSLTSFAPAPRLVDIVRYTEEQIRRLEESIRIRHDSESVELVQRYQSRISLNLMGYVAGSRYNSEQQPVLQLEMIRRFRSASHWVAASLGNIESIKHTACTLFPLQTAYIDRGVFYQVFHYRGVFCYTKYSTTVERSAAIPMMMKCMNCVNGQTFLEKLQP